MKLFIKRNDNSISYPNYKTFKKKNKHNSPFIIVNYLTIPILHTDVNKISVKKRGF